MIFNQTEKQEKEYLQQVITTIHDTINTTSTSVKEHIDTLQEYKDYLWSNKDIDPHEIRSMPVSYTHLTLPTKQNTGYPLFRTNRLSGKERQKPS